MRNFVNQFMSSAEVKMQQGSSPQKVQKTGNVVLDRINREVEKQRNQQMILLGQISQDEQELFQAALLSSSEESENENEQDDDKEKPVEEKKEGDDTNKGDSPDTKKILIDQTDKATVQSGLNNLDDEGPALNESLNEDTPIQASTKHKDSQYRSPS